MHRSAASAKALHTVASITARSSPFLNPLGTSCTSGAKVTTCSFHCSRNSCAAFFRSGSTTRLHTCPQLVRALFLFGAFRLVRLQPVSFYFYAVFFFLAAVLPKIFLKLFALTSSECVVSLEPKATRHSAPSRDIPRIQRDYLLAIDDAPTRASQVPRSCGSQTRPGQYEAKDACGGFCPARPRCRRSNHVCETQETQAPGRDYDHCSHLENLERCRDPLVWKQVGWSKTASIVRGSSRRSRTRGAKMSGRGGYEERRWTLCDGHGVHSLQLEEGRSAAVSMSFPRLWKVLVSFDSGLRSRRVRAASHRPRGTPSTTELAENIVNSG